MNPVVHFEVGGTNIDELGAKTLVGPIVISAGQFAWLSDPTGTAIGLWQDA